MDEMKRIMLPEKSIKDEHKHFTTTKARSKMALLKQDIE